MGADQAGNWAAELRAESPEAALTVYDIASTVLACKQKGDQLMFTVSRFIRIMAVVALLAPAVAFGAAAKKYQVTGKVLEVTDTMIAVDKDGDRWEINRDKDSKINGDLKVGAKVTIHYRMVASGIDVKAEKTK